MTKSTVIKNLVFPTCIVLVTAATFIGFRLSAQQSPVTSAVNVLSANITTSPIRQVAHETKIKGFGEVMPAEVTALSTRVSGTVVAWADGFVRGGVVKQGEVLFKLEDSRYVAELKNAQSELLRAKAVLEQELGRSKVAKSELERINAQDQNKLFLREPQINSAYGEVLAAEAAVVLAQKNLDSTTIKAPYNALVVERNIGLGQFVAIGSAVATLYNIDKAEIEVPIAKFDSRFLPVQIDGQQVKVHLPNSDFFVSGRLSRSLKLTDNRTRANSLIVTVDKLYEQRQDGQSLQFGDYVEVEINGRVLERVYKIPEYLVSNNQVWTMTPQNQLALRGVVTLRNEGGFAIIQQGFEQRDKLVVSVPENPHPGMAVNEVALASDERKEKL